MNLLLAGLFLVVYGAIAAKEVPVLRIGRTAAAVVGAVAIVAVGALSPRYGLRFAEAEEAIERSTLLLLFGTMVVARGFVLSGAFARAAGGLTPLLGRPRLLLAAVTVGAGLASALLVNDAVCLLGTPFLLPPLRRAGLPLRPYLFAIAMGSNAGSALTLGGNPQNMLVARLSGLGYGAYARAAALPTTLALAATVAVLLVAFRGALRAPKETPPSLPAAAPPEALDRPLAGASVAALAALVVVALAGAPLAGAALIAAALVLVVARTRAAALLEGVDWNVLVFFAALFVLVAALGKTGVVPPLLAALPRPAGVARLPVLAGVLLGGSQLVSNVPLILLLEPWLRSLGAPAATWTTTALVATLAGNLTVLGSVANVIVFEQARGEGEPPVGFLEHARLGVPATLLGTALALAAVAVTSR